MLKAPTKHGVYVVDWVSKHINEIAALNASILPYPSENPVRTMPHRVRAFPAEHSLDHDIDMQPEEEASSASDSDAPPPGGYKAWNLWHRRFAHLGHNTIRKLHRVTTLKKPIPCPKSEKPCEVCSLTKMRQRLNRTVKERKANLLDLASIDRRRWTLASITLRQLLYD